LKVRQRTPNRRIAVQTASAALLSILFATAIAATYLAAGTSPQMTKQSAATSSNTSTPGFAPPATPISNPTFNLLLNGSATYPSYTVSPGQEIVVVVQVNESQPVSVALSARQQNTSAIPSQPGITTQLSAQTFATTASEIYLRISIAGNVSPGTYPMAVDAIENGTPGQVGFQAGFGLVVIG
jgi:hypothetical protein